MSTRIRISYEHQHELDAMLKLLKAHIQKCKVQPGEKPYQHAYLWMKNTPTPAKNSGGIKPNVDTTP